MNNTNKTSKAFEQLTSSTELIEYLDQKARLNSSQYVYQYTTISSLVSMFRSHTLHLGNAKYMNDQLEYQNGSYRAWKNLFFSCFMLEDKESIGMWSMYAQPWQEGVKIAISKDALRQMVSETTEIIELSQDTKQPTGRTINTNNGFRLWISAVAYSNYDGIDLKKENEQLNWGKQSNDKIHGAPHKPELTGYIKDMAWSYEKEIRIKAQFDNWMNFERVAIELPEYVVDSMIITPSPLFEGDFKKRLEDEISRQIKTEKSIFAEKLKIKTACDRCSIKNLK